MSPTMVGEDAMSFVMHDGKSTFPVPKAGLSAQLQAKIRSMSSLSPQVTDPVPAMDGGQNLNVANQTGDAGMPQVQPFDINHHVGRLQQQPSFSSQSAGDADEVKRAADFAQSPARAAKELGIRPVSSRPEIPVTPAVPTAPVAPAARPVGGGMPGMRDIAGGIEVQKGAAIQSANLAAEQGREAADVLAATEKQLQAHAIQERAMQDQARVRADRTMSDYKAAQDEMRNINTTVDPGRHWASRSTAGKITGIIGLALGALGAGPDGINHSATMLNQAIDRDLDAQKAEHTLRMQKGKASIDAATSAYAMERQRFGDEASASNAAKASMLGLAENTLKKIAAGAKGPAEQLQAQALLGQLQTQKGQLEAGLYDKAFDSQTQRLAVEGRAPGVDKDQRKQVMEIEEREREIQQSGNKLKALIGQHGTQEKWAPGVEAEMNQAINGMIIASAKMQDREGVVREPDELREKASLGFSPGFFQRGESALKSIDSYMKNAERRRGNALSVRGLQ